MSARIHSFKLSERSFELVCVHEANEEFAFFQDLLLRARRHGQVLDTEEDWRYVQDRLPELYRRVGESWLATARLTSEDPNSVSIVVPESGKLTTDKVGLHQKLGRDFMFLFIGEEDDG